MLLTWSRAPLGSRSRNTAIGSTMIEASQLAELASIPSKEGLFSMLLSCLQGSIRNLAYGLKAVSEHKQ